MDLQLSLAILVGKTIGLINKLTGSGATAAPGLYALKIDPNLIKKLSGKIEFGNVVISGTNGKTTTTRLTSHILPAKYKIIHNRQGSNLLRGIASTLIKNTSIGGKINGNLGLWEVDEATLPQALENLNPNKIVLLNLFRDQLDRYGEIDSVRKKWQTSLSKLQRGATLILNADDPGIAYLAKDFKGKTVCFGVEDKKLDLPQTANVADIHNCLNCGSKLVYSTVLSSHMGHYSCTNCGLKRPNVQVGASHLKFNPDFSTSFDLSINNYQLQTTHFPLPGLYNAYNVLAASALCDNLQTDHTRINQRLTDFQSAFGRFQTIEVGTNKKVTIFLIKNPTGANEVLRILSLKSNLSVLVALNDNFADGTDVSWIWDTDWEILTPKIKHLAVCGTRCWDMATRLKYADFKLSKNNVYEDINYSLQNSVESLSENETLIILPTYTAMLEIQKSLNKIGGVKWHEQ
ncbi:MAG TPA: MurT ligase domain-containing protein [Candidatus Saccharimonadales bacterium]|nr:MurT ligase domain-containing protein [Candidatus Saccharimonadales bacterium]